MSAYGGWISLVFQFIASFCWAIGAGIAEPEEMSDYLQFFAAVAWCVANLASFWFLLVEKKSEDAMSANRSKSVEFKEIKTRA